MTSHRSRLAYRQATNQRAAESVCQLRPPGGADKVWEAKSARAINVPTALPHFVINSDSCEV